MAAADRIILTGGCVAPDVRKRRDEGEAAVMNTAVRNKIYRSSVKRAWVWARRCVGGAEIEARWKGGSVWVAQVIILSILPLYKPSLFLPG